MNSRNISNMGKPGPFSGFAWVFWLTAFVIAGQSAPTRAETFNAFDRVQFNAPVTTATSSDFGRITSQANAPRSVQFAVRLMW